MSEEQITPNAEINKEPQDRKHSDKDLKEIARDLYSGQIFSDRHINTPRDDPERFSSDLRLV